jgi:transcriptional regulator with XRE-family HTH domain
MNVPPFILALAKERVRRGMTQHTVANIAEFAETSICLYENGQRGWQAFWRLQRWADALDVEIIIRRKRHDDESNIVGRDVVGASSRHSETITLQP